MELAEIVEILNKRVYDEAFDYLEIPPIEECRLNKYKMNRENIISKSSFFQRFRKLDQYTHGLRVACYSIRIMDYLGFQDNEYRQHFFVASLLHDGGKAVVMDLIDKRTDFTQEDMEKMKEHPCISKKLIIDAIDPIAGLIAEGHHSYQPDGYPKNLKKESPEIEYLRKILGIIDFYDSASTRDNDRIKKGLEEHLLRHFRGIILPCKNTVKKLLIKSYGKIDMGYNGQALPKCDCSGKQFIKELYSAKIFGSADILNPFKEPFSFTYKK